MRIRVAAALSFGRSNARGRKYCAQLIGFLEQRAELAAGRQLAFTDHFQPEGGLVRFLQRAVDARDEFSRDRARHVAL